MANKAYNVDLNVRVGDSVNNISELLEKLITLKNEANNLSDSEIALNVVVRNQGFDAAMKQMAAQLKTANTSAKAVGEGFDKSMDTAVDNLQKNISRINESIKGIGEAINKTFEGVEKSIKTHVKAGISAGFKEGMTGWRDGISTRVTGIRDNLKEALKGFDGIEEKFNNLADQMERAARLLKMSAEGIIKQGQLSSMEAAKILAKAEADTKFISKRDQIYAENDARRVENERVKGEKEFIASQRRESRNNKREEARLDKESASRIRETEQQINTLKKQERREEAEANKAEVQTAKTAWEWENKKQGLVMAEARMRKQLKAIADEQVAAEEIGMRDRTEYEQKVYELKNAEKRIEYQIDSTNRQKVVSEQAIAKAAEERRRKELAVYREIVKQVSGYNQIKDHTKRTVEHLNKVSNVLQKVSSMIGSVNSMFGTMRSWANQMGNMIMKAGQTGLRYATQAARTMASTASEQYQKLEVARIGFENFFGEAGAKSLIPRIQQEAINAPGLNSGDLADYVRQLAPVSTGNADLALNAALGMLKTIQYGGAEGSEEMEYVIKNVRDVISKGQATAIDLRQFNRAMPILEDVLGKIGKSDFIKDGKLNITKENAKDIMAAFADINTDSNSPVADIYEKMGNTLEGLREAIKEQFTTGLNNTLVDLGFYDKVKELLKKIKDDGILEEFFTWVGNVANNVLDALKALDWKNIKAGAIDGMSRIWDGIKKAAKSIMSSLGAMNIGDLIIKVSDIIAHFIEGFGQGISQILDIINWAEKNLGSDVLNKAATFLGMLASPLGNLLQSAGKLAQDVLYFFSRGTSILGQGINWAGNKKLAKLDSLMNIPSYYAANKTFLDATYSQNMMPLLTADGAKMYGNWQKQNAAVLNKAQNVFSYYDKNQGQWVNRTANTMKATERWNIIGDGNTAKGAVKAAASTFKAGAQKAISALAIYEVGKTVSAVAGQIASSATGSSDVGGVVTALGDAASAGIAVGSKFGLIAGMGAALVSSIDSVIKEQEKLAEATKKLHQTEMEAATLSYANDLAFNVFDQIKNMRDAQGNPLYQAYDDASQSAYDVMMDKARELADRTDIGAMDAMKQIRDAYLETYSKNKGIGLFNEWGEEREVSGSTAINYDARQADLKKIYDNMVKMGWILEANLFDKDENGNPINVSGQEYANYIRKATGGQMTIDTEEAATEIAKKTEELVKQFDANMGLNIDIKYRDEEGNELSEDDWLAYHNLISTGNGGFVKKNYIEAYIDVHSSDKDLLRKLLDANADNVQIKTEVNKKGVASAKPLQTGLGIDPFTGQPFGMITRKYNGGLVRPIYRADGGETPARGVDTVPMMSQPGEFVMRKSAASKLGLGVLNALNFGDVAHAARLLGGKISQSWNNSRSYTRSISANRNTINNYNNFNITNRSRSGFATSMNIANRLATGY